jgi:hypothetical protein
MTLPLLALSPEADVDGLAPSVNGGANSSGGGGGSGARNGVADAAAPSAERDLHYPGFLTDTKLIALEFQDPVFRRQILVQMLIVIHYLLDRSVHPPKAKDLSRKAVADLTALQDRALKQLEETPPRSVSAASHRSCAVGSSLLLQCFVVRACVSEERPC